MVRENRRRSDSSRLRRLARLESAIGSCRVRGAGADGQNDLWRLPSSRIGQSRGLDRERSTREAGVRAGRGLQGG